MIIAKDLSKTLCKDLSFRFGGASSSVQYRYLTDGTAIIRKGVRDSAFVVDLSLTALSFNGIEDIDWETLKSNQ